MAIIQDAYNIPDDIATKLATGVYKRYGSVIRYATGSKKGQIVTHLDPVNLETAKKAQSLGEKALEFARQNPKATKYIAIGTLAGAVGLCWWGYTKWKNREPQVLQEFRTKLKTYIYAIRNGNLNVEQINHLMNSIDKIKKHKDYEDITIQLTLDELEVLLERIYEYTLELAEKNNVEISSKDLFVDKNAIIALSSCLKVQKYILTRAA